MLNRKKVQAMSKVALYEHGEGKETLKLNKYYKKDYTSAKILSSLPLGIITGILITALIFVVNMEWPMQLYRRVGGVMAVLLYAICFAIFVLAYCFFSAFMYNRKYETYRGNLRVYGLNLRRLEKIYEEEEQAANPRNE